MSYEISKRWTFSASHVLSGLPEEHQCSRLHGHNYIFELVLASDVLTPQGFVVDYGELKAIKIIIDERLDHRHLNDIFDFNPTAENLARYMFDMARVIWPETVAFRVSETPNTWAEWRR